MKSFIKPKESFKIKIKKKRLARFQLLEVLVAIFLLVVCAAPALKIHVAMYLEQHHILRQNKRDHLVHLVHAAIIEKLYKNEIPFDSLVEKVPFPFKENQVNSKFSLKNNLKNLNYHCCYFFTNLEDKDKHHLFKLTIRLEDVKKNKSKERKDFIFDYEYLVYISLESSPQSSPLEESIE